MPTPSPMSKRCEAARCVLGRDSPRMGSGCQTRCSEPRSAGCRNGRGVSSVATVSAAIYTRSSKSRTSRCLSFSTMSVPDWGPTGCALMRWCWLRASGSSFGVVSRGLPIRSTPIGRNHLSTGVNESSKCSPIIRSRWLASWFSSTRYMRAMRTRHVPTVRSIRGWLACSSSMRARRRSMPRWVCSWSGRCSGARIRSIANGRLRTSMPSARSSAEALAIVRLSMRARSVRRGDGALALARSSFARSEISPSAHLPWEIGRDVPARRRIGKKIADSRS